MTHAPPADTLQAVELADGVEIHLRVAGPGVRSAAWALDALLYSLLMFVVSIVILLTLGPALGDQVASGVMLLLWFAMLWFYNVFFEMGKKAATPGQRVMGIKVASVSGGPVRLPQSIIRNFLRVVDFMPAFYLFGFVCCLFNQRFQRLGDLVADTVVVYADKAPRHKVSPVKVRADPTPPTAPLTRAEQAALLEFLERAPSWSDARKLELSDILRPLTEKEGMAGLVRLCGMALWVQEGVRHRPAASAHEPSTRV